MWEDHFSYPSSVEDNFIITLSMSNIFLTASTNLTQHPPITDQSDFHLPSNNVLEALFRKERSRPYSLLQKLSKTKLKHDNNSLRTEDNKENISPNDKEEGIFSFHELYLNYAGNKAQLSRKDICLWCHKTLNFFHRDLEILETCMNNLDRVLALRIQTCHKKASKIQITVMACLHIAIELSPNHQAWHGNKNPWYKAFASASNEGIAPKDIMLEESRVLFELDWYINSPSCMSFLKALVPSTEWMESICIYQKHSSYLNPPFPGCQNKSIEPFLAEVCHLLDYTTLDNFFFGCKSSSIVISVIQATLNKSTQSRSSNQCPNISKKTLKMVSKSLELLHKRGISCNGLMAGEAIDSSEVRDLQNHFREILDNRFPDVVSNPKTIVFAKKRYPSKVDEGAAQDPLSTPTSPTGVIFANKTKSLSCKDSISLKNDHTHDDENEKGTNRRKRFKKDHHSPLHLEFHP